MRIMDRFERCLDRLVPSVEASARSRAWFSAESFRALMDYMVSEYGLELKSRSENTCVMAVEGRTIGNLSQVKSIFGEADPDRYGNMKSRCRFVLCNDGTLEITSYEHLMGMANEREAFREVLGKRLDLFMEVVENGEV